MILRTGTTLQTLRRLNTFDAVTANREYRIEYDIKLLPADLAAGITLVTATLVILTTFGALPAVITKTITLLPNLSTGQITDGCGGDGLGALHFVLLPDDTAQIVGPHAYEVVVQDSLGRLTTLDAGAIITHRAAGDDDGDGDVDSVVVTPASASLIVTNGLVFSATPFDEDGAPLPGRVIEWSSTDEAVATVDEDGLVTPVGTGTCLITATCEGVTGGSAVSSRRLVIGAAVRIG